MRRALQRHWSTMARVRTFSSSASSASLPFSVAPIARQSKDSYTELLMYTQTILDRKQTPLGSLITKDWDIVLQGMSVWLSSSNSNTTQTSPYIPRHVYHHFLLLERLLYEKEAVSSDTIQQQHQQLQEAVQLSLQAWQRVSQDFPRATLPIRSAVKLWKHNLRQRHSFCPFQYWNQLTGLLSMHQQHAKSTFHPTMALDFCQLLLTHVTVAEMQELETVVSNKEHQDNEDSGHAIRTMLKTYFGQAVELSVQMRARDGPQRPKKPSLLMPPSTTIKNTEHATTVDWTVMLSDLLQRMQDLSHLPDWHDIRVQDSAQLDHVLDALLRNDTNDSSAVPTLSAFEQAALQERILQRLARAGLDDRASVEGLIGKWKRQQHGSSAPFAQAVVDYFLRIQDSKSATKWMQILDAVPMNSDEKTHSGKRLDEGVVRGKLELLTMQLAQADSPQAPWRATEILESLERNGVLVDSSVYESLVKVWFEWGATEDVVSLKKAVEIGMRSPNLMTTEMLNIIVQLLHRMDKHTKGAAFETALNLLDQLVTDNSFSAEVGVPIVSALSPLCPGSQRLLEAVRALILGGASVPPFAVEHVLEHSSETKLSPRDVSARLSVLDHLRDSGEPITLKCYQLSLQLLLVHCNEPQIDRAVEILSEILDLAAKGDVTILSGVAHQIHAVLNHIRDADKAWGILKQAEEKLVVPGREHFAAPTPMKFYKRYTLLYHKDLGFIENMFQFLKNRHESGFKDLYPDNDLYKKYVEALEESKGLDSLETRLALLDDLIQRYENRPDQEDLRPHFHLFDSVISGLYLRSKRNANKLPSQEADPFEQCSRQMIRLIEKLHLLRIAPDRAFVFNVSMETLLKCRNKALVFKAAMDVKWHMSELRIEPNMNTIVSLLQACKLAAVANKTLAMWGMTAMIEALTEARRMHRADDRLYFTCFEVVFANLRWVDPKKKDEADKILAALFECCCEDGALSNYAKDMFLRLATRKTAEKLYDQKLLDDKTEPPEWSTNVRNIRPRAQAA